MSIHPLLAVIPARGGSKGLPGKNVRPLLDRPLIGHSIALAALCPEIDRAIVSTDSEEIAEVARSLGGDVPFLRPAELAQDRTPMMPVLQHALREIEAQEGRQYRGLLLLDPTSPCRLPEEVAAAASRAEREDVVDGVIAVSRPEFSPFWHCMVPEGDLIKPLFDEAASHARRQELPPVFRINGLLYLWRRDFLLGLSGVGSGWLAGRLAPLEVPEVRAITIDNADEFSRAELFLRHGVITLPWVEPT